MRNDDSDLSFCVICKERFNIKINLIRENR